MTCVECRSALTGELAPHVCAACGRPQPLAASETGRDPFAAFGLPRRFGLDTAEAERKFYEFSRVLHPDRFVTAAPEAREDALRRMSAVNDAYRILRDPRARRERLLELESSGNAEPVPIPLDLSEEWFEVQELLQSQPGEGRRRADALVAEVEARLERGRAEIGRMEETYDALPDPATLARMRQASRVGAYLESLRRDVGRRLSAR